MKFLHCTSCQQRVFFENTQCTHCAAQLGFVPEEQQMVAFEVAAVDAHWPRLGAVTGQPPDYRPCINREPHQICNWMVSTLDGESLCRSCRTTAVLPDLSQGDNLQYWRGLESAKRRMLYSLLTMGLAFPSKGEDPERGLAFHFLESTEGIAPVLTGHDEGVITLNIAEADDARREGMRHAMHEPYRTLLGHFRHEVGHYFWDRLIRDSGWITRCRDLFGDDSADYAAALKKHYDEGAPANWPEHFISEYATTHAWEDWAECWSHYMNLVDGLETAHAWGLELHHALPGHPSVQPQPTHGAEGSIADSVVQQWLPVSQFVNAMNRSLGVNDGYPFVVSPTVVQKMDFIHTVVTQPAPLMSATDIAVLPTDAVVGIQDDDGHAPAQVQAQVA